MAKQKKLTLGSMKQVHGQLEGKTVPQKLSQIIAAKNGEEVDENFGPYETKDLEVYEDYLSNSSRADLDAHADKVGIIPSGDTKSLARKLVSEFKRHWQGNQPLPAPVRFTEEQKAKFKSIKF